MISENSHGKAYARSTATAINRKQNNSVQGQRVTVRDTFTTTSKKEFSPVNFRRYLERPDIMQNRDYYDYSKNLNDEMHDFKAKIIQKDTTNDMATTLCSRTGTNFYPRQTARQARLSTTNFGVNPEEAELKPKLLESKVVNHTKFFSLSNGFQKAFANDDKDKQMSIPIAGYSGHQRGDKAQNYFGRTFRDSAIQSKRLERSLKR